MEKRQGERVGFRVWADNNSEQEIALWLGSDFSATGDFKFCYSSKDISQTGMFLETMTPLGIDDVLNLEFNMPGVEKSITVSAKVVRITKNGDSGDGMGVEFIELNDDDKKFVNEFVEKYYASDIN